MNYTQSAKRFTCRNIAEKPKDKEKEKVLKIGREKQIMYKGTPIV